MRLAALATIVAGLVAGRVSALPLPPAGEPAAAVRRAVELGRAGRLEEAEAELLNITRLFPGEAAPWRELAAVRFRRRLWATSAEAAKRAVTLDAGDRDAWQLLGADRFLLHEPERALDAWNVIGAPLVNTIRIDASPHGDTDDRHAGIASALGMRPGDLLTASSLRRARRRLELRPDLEATRIAYRPTAGGEADVEIAVIDRQGVWPVRPGRAVTVGIRSGLERTVSISSPAPGGVVGQVTCRWEPHRPRMAIGIEKAVSWFEGLNVGFEVAAETQTYAVAVAPRPGDAAGEIEEKLRQALVTVRWASADWISGASAGFHELAGSGDFVSLGGSAERRSPDDRRIARITMDAWTPLHARDLFVTRLELGAFLDEPLGSHLDLDARIGWSGVTRGTRAPRALWSGAGTGRGRGGWLRAHPLLDHGVVVGPAFAPSLASGGLELIRWFTRAAGVAGAAVFIDAAGVTGRGAGTPARAGGAGGRVFADAGAGLRIRAPGHAGRVHLDFARSLTDRGHAVSIAWQPAH